jgi:hypothetical protein
MLTPIKINSTLNENGFIDSKIAGAAIFAGDEYQTPV